MSQTWKDRYLNAFVVYFLLGPVMGVAWISIWILLSEEIIYPEDKGISVWISFAIGYTSNLVAAHFQDNIHDLATGHGYVFFLVFSRVYSYYMFFVSGNAWRAIWEGLDYYTEISEYNALVTGFGSYAALLVLRSSRQVVFAPCVLSMEFPIKDYFAVASYFDVKKPKECARIGDTLFSVFVVGTLGFTVWRGFWQYLDFIVFPDDYMASGFCSLIISYGILIVVTVLQPPMVWLSKKLYRTNYLLGLIYEDVVIFANIVSCINFWRGYGILYDLYIPGGMLRYWLGHVVCCIILFFSMSFNSVIARGVAAEGQTKDGQGVVNGIEYLANFTQMWKSSAESIKRTTCRNICMVCSQAWDESKKKDPSVVALHVTDATTGMTSPTTADFSNGDFHHPDKHMTDDCALVIENGHNDKHKLHSVAPLP